MFVCLFVCLFVVLRDVENLAFRHKKESKEYKTDMANLIRRYLPMTYKTKVSSLLVEHLQEGGTPIFIVIGL